MSDAAPAATEDQNRAMPRWNWRHALGELTIVVVGILIALAVNNWAQARRDHATEARYLERLLADGSENLQLLQRQIDMHKRRAGTLKNLSAWLAEDGARPTDEALREILCRWFIQPPLGLRRGTYAELVSTGNLGLLRTVQLRLLLEQAEASHRDAAVLDSLDGAMQRVSAPLEHHRRWRISPEAWRGVDCEFDFDGMRSDTTIRSVVAQIYRGETSCLAFRERELAAVRALQQYILSARNTP